GDEPRVRDAVRRRVQLRQRERPQIAVDERDPAGRPGLRAHQAPDRPRATAEVEDMIALAYLRHLDHRSRAVVEAPVAECARAGDELHRRPVAQLRVDLHLVPAALLVLRLRAPERHAILARWRLAALPEHLLVPLGELVVLLVLRER